MTKDMVWTPEHLEVFYHYFDVQPRVEVKRRKLKLYSNTLDHFNSLRKGANYCKGKCIAAILIYCIKRYEFLESRLAGMCTNHLVSSSVEGVSIDLPVALINDMATFSASLAVKNRKALSFQKITQAGIAMVLFYYSICNEEQKNELTQSMQLLHDEYRQSLVK